MCRVSSNAIMIMTSRTMISGAPRMLDRDLIIASDIRPHVAPARTL